MFMLGLFKLLVFGLNNELAYRKLKFGNADYLFIKKQWESRLYNVTKKMNFINEAIIRKFNEQSKTDTAVISMKNPRNVLSNKMFSEKLYNVLVQKYDWRDWLVIVYKPIYGSPYHNNFICAGFRQYRMYGRNLLVASVDQSNAPINTTVAEQVISDINTKHTSCQPSECRYTGSYPIVMCSNGGCSTHNDNALEVYNSMPLTNTRNCSVYSSMGVIDSWVDLWYQGKSDRLVHHRTPGSNSYSIHLFG